MFGATIPVFECLFKGTDAIEGFSRGFNEEAYQALPHLYGVCISDDSTASRQIVGGFFIKTSFTHNDGNFINVFASTVDSSKNLSRFRGPQFSFLPARLEVDGSASLSEDEMLRFMLKQFLKHAVSGSA